MSPRLEKLAVFLLVSVLVIAGAAQAGPGALDPTFGGGGTVKTSIGANAAAHAVVLQPDGDIVAAGQSSLGFTLARYDSACMLDATFGSSGIVTTAIGASAAATGLVLQPDGKLVAAGWTSDGTNDALALARYQPDGSLDLGFGTAGIVTTPVGSTSRANALVRQTDGKLVVAGYTDSGSGPAFALARYDASGVLDATFGSGGVVTTAIDANAHAVALALQGDGKLVAAGNAGSSGSSFDFALVRYDTSGVPDPTFGSGGIVTTPFADFSSANAVVVQPDGKIVAAGSERVSIAVARYGASGGLDASFGSGGKVVLGGGGTSAAAASAALFQAPDAIIVAGSVATITSIHPPMATSDFTFVRFRDDTPTIDASGGTNLGSDSNFISAVVLQLDEKLVAAGGSGGAFGLARYDATICGNGVIEDVEQCDDGNRVNGDGCDNNCTFTGCGNGIVTAGETCDDGNTVDGDCCSSTCQIGAAGSACTDDGNPCRDDVCDAGGHCTHPPNSAPCDDGNMCTSPDVCQNGFCVGTPNSLPCDDGNACTGNDVCNNGQCQGTPAVVCPTCEACAPADGSCVAAPHDQCRLVTVGAASRLGIHAASDPAGDYLQWNWSRGSNTPIEAFGDPIATDDYTLCVFDASGPSPVLVTRATAPHGDLCAGEPCWMTAGKSKLKYSDPDRTPDGVSKIFLKAGTVPLNTRGKAGITFKARGEHLVMPTLPLGVPTVVQVLSGNGSCWEATFPQSGVKKNDGSTFKGVGQ